MTPRPPKPNLLDRLMPGRWSRKLQAYRNSRFLNQVSAINAANGGGSRGGKGRWMGMPADEDSANKEYAQDRPAIMQRSQDLDVNNSDVGGFHRARVAQVLGAGVHFRHCPVPAEIGLTEEQATDVGEKIDRLRKLHSEQGGFDSQKGQAWEGKRQEVAQLTAFVYGSCLIHRVVPRDPNALIPLSLELIPGSRISTPYDKLGDPKVSYGVAYTDEHRTRVTGYYVRRVSKTIGNSFVPDYNWDFLPVEDCSLLELTEPAGIDQPLPLCTRNMRMLRNRAEFLENTVEAVRAQSAHYANIKCAPGTDPYNLALDDSMGSTSGGAAPHGFVDIGDGVRAYYSVNGQELEFLAAHLPEPELAPFLDYTDQRLARGYAASTSRFTRKVTSSWAGGRMEDQQDQPIIDQYRLALKAAWHKVNGWVLDAIYLSGAIDLPGYGRRNRHAWNQFAAEFPGTPDINPTDTASADEKNLMLRKVTPQQLIERGGNNPRAVVRGWVGWTKMLREEEQKGKIPEGSLDILFSGKAVTTEAGDDVAAASGQAQPEPAPGGGAGGKKGKGRKGNKGKPTNGHRVQAGRFAGVFNQ